jgi:hypothetical protein
MRKYKTQLQEVFKELLKYDNYKIFDVEHSMERFKQRIGNNVSLYFILLRKSILWLVKNKKDAIEDRYIFISKKYKFGIQLHWRQDRFSGKFNGYTATTLSKDEMNFFTKADKKVFLENTQLELKDSYCRYLFEGDLKKETNLINMDMFLEEDNVCFTYEFVEL